MLVNDNVPLPRTPSPKPSELKEECLSPWKIRKAVTGCAKPITLAAESTASPRARADGKPYQALNTLKDIWEQGMKEKTCSVLLVAVQSQVHQFDGKMRSQQNGAGRVVAAWGLDEESRWVSFRAYDDLANVLLQFMAGGQQDFSFCQFSSIQHARGKRNDDGTMHFKLLRGCQMQRFSPSPLWQECEPEICDDLSALEDVADGSRCFLQVRIRDMQEIVPGEAGKSERLQVTVMCKHGHERGATFWPPNTRLPFLKEGCIVVIMGCGISFDYNRFSVGTDCCARLDSSARLGEFERVIRSSRWTSKSATAAAFRD